MKKHFIKNSFGWFALSLAAFMLCVPSLSQAQSVEQTSSVIKQVKNSSINSTLAPNCKTNKQLMAYLKKQHQLRKVEIELEENNGFHFILTDKRGSKGVADHNGNVLFAPKYAEIDYVPALSAGYGIGMLKPSNYELKDCKVYHPATPAHYMCSVYKFSHERERNHVDLDYKSVDILDANGHVVKEGIDYRLATAPGYLCVGAHSAHSIMGEIYFSGYGKLVGLMSAMGDVILEPIYEKIELKDTVCTYVHTVDGVKRYGAMLLNHTEDRVPATFHQVRRGKDGKWLVMRNSTSKEEVYCPENSAKDDEVAYRDDGERFYEQGRYDDVIKYYAEQGVAAPWAKFFTAQAVYQKAKSEKDKVYEFKVKVDIHKRGTIPVIDWKMMRNQFAVAKQLYEMYLTEDDTYKEQAQSGVGMCEVHLESIDKGKLKAEFNNVCNKLKQYEAEAYAREQRAMQQRQQQAAIISGMMSNMLGSIMKSANEGSQRTITSRATASRTASTSSAPRASSTHASNDAATDEYEVVEKKTKCNECSGSGTCKYCNGVGKKSYGGKYQTCVACNGSSKCIICRGTGFSRTTYENVRKR